MAPLALLGSRIPSDPRNISAEDKTRIVQAIGELRRLSEKMEAYQRTRKVLPLKASEITKYWKDGLFKWFTYLFDFYFPLASESNFPSRYEALTCLSCVFAYFLNNDNNKLVVGTSGVPQLATRLWLITDYDYKRSEYSLYCGWWAPFIALMVYSSASPSTTDKIYEVEGVSKGVIIDLTLKRLQSSTETDYCSYQQYSRLLGVIMRFDPADPSLGVSPNRIVRTLCSTVGSMVLDVMDMGDEPTVGIVDACLQFFPIIQFTLERLNSVDAVHDAIQSGFMAALLDFSPYFEWHMQNDDSPSSLKTIIDKTATIFTHTLPRFLAYSSVLSAVNKYTYDPNMHESMVGREWTIFCNAVRTYQNRLSGNFPRIAFCDNPKHDVRSNYSSKIWECSRCTSAWYCSEKCQKEHWVDTHRRQCSSCIKFREANSYPALRNRDHRSICRLAVVMALEKWNLVERSVEDLLSSEPELDESDVMIMLDHTVRSPGLYVTEKDPIAMLITKHMPKATVIRFHVPLGIDLIVTLTTAGYINPTERESQWITGKMYTTYRVPKKA